MSWICKYCLHTQESEPEWRWETIQQDEAYRIPTCPQCGWEMVEAEECPLCGEPMLPGQPTCILCHAQIAAGIETVMDRITKVNKELQWETVGFIAEAMRERYEKERRRK